MGSVDRMDGRSFKANFSGEGVGKLREKVEEKLKEFMGDYTDNTLVEYVIVLLRNGRHKEEARNELNVFLGDDSDSFVSWLWDHLASNLDLYVESQGSHVDDVPKTKPAVVEQARRNDILHLKSEIEVKPDKLSRSRHNRDWKRLGKDEDQPPPLLSSVIYSNHPEEKNDHEVSRGRRSQSPRPRVQRKRSRHDEHQNTKRDAVSQVHATASRRLLQFAVRDAVATAKPSNAAITEPTSKRLRSIVSTSTTTGGSSAIAPARHLQSVARVANPMASVIKAVAEAAEDATRVRSSSVFDRLGRGASGSSGQAAEFDAPTVEDGDYEDIIEMEDKPHLTYDDRRRFIQNTRMLRSEIGLTSDSVSDNEEYDDLNIAGGRLMDVSQTLTSREIRDENSMMVQYNVAKNSNDVMRISRNTEEDQLPVPGNTSHKIVNISVNLNTWKPNKYLEPREVAKLDGKKGLLENAVGAGESRSGMQLMKENDNPVIVGNGNGNSASMPQKESQKAPFPGTGLFAAARPLEDTDSRTIFVSNVHFAATKDSLSRHFNKFGEVLKVIIVTDAANGQPKGVAYVEFMRKEAADNALSLDGTSFMSRILKVVKRSSAHQEVSPVMASWPRFARGSPFVASRFGRVPFPRGIASTFRPPRLPSKPGARSFQWKRDAQATPSDSSVSSVLGINTALPSTPRSLTYVRTEPKPDGNLGSA